MERGELIHRINDLDIELAQFRRRENENLILLKEALDAHRKGYFHVVMDHLERVIDNMEDSH